MEFTLGQQRQLKPENKKEQDKWKNVWISLRTRRSIWSEAERSQFELFSLYRSLSRNQLSRVQKLLERLNLCSSKSLRQLHEVNKCYIYNISPRDWAQFFMQTWLQVPYLMTHPLRKKIPSFIHSVILFSNHCFSHLYFLWYWISVLSLLFSYNW